MNMAVVIVGGGLIYISGAIATDTFWLSLIINIAGWTILFRVTDVVRP